MWPSFSKLLLVMGGANGRLHRISLECFAGLAYPSSAFPRSITASTFIGVNFHALIAIQDESPQDEPALRFCMRVISALRTAVLMEGLLSLQYGWQLFMTQCSLVILRQLTVLFSVQFAVIFKLTPASLCAATRSRNLTIICRA
jgi:hypothetical protein